MADDWYEKVAPGELHQGQIFDFRLQQTAYRFVNDRPVIYLTDAKVIVLTQSCDLLRPEKNTQGTTMHNVLVSPLIPLAQHLKQSSQVKSVAKDLASNFKLTQFHWLPANPAFNMDYSLVPFALVTSVPYDALKETASLGESIRLKSPYVENLAHRFGIVFSRVALPENSFDTQAYSQFYEGLKTEKSNSGDP